VKLPILLGDSYFLSLQYTPRLANLDYGLPTQAGKVVKVSGEEKRAMNCKVAGCHGEYELRTVTHTVKQRGEILVIDHVPAEVCNFCGDVVLAPETVRRIEALVKATPPPTRNIAFYELA
jgi:YgiT-type zinc finger domain-containing protein